MMPQDFNDTLARGFGGDRGFNSGPSYAQPTYGGSTAAQPGFESPREDLQDTWNDDPAPMSCPFDHPLPASSGMGPTRGMNTPTHAYEQRTSQPNQASLHQPAPNAAPIPGRREPTFDYTEVGPSNAMSMVPYQQQTTSPYQQQQQTTTLHQGSQGQQGQMLPHRGVVSQQPQSMQPYQSHQSQMIPYQGIQGQMVPYQASQGQMVPYQGNMVQQQQAVPEGPQSAYMQQQMQDWNNRFTQMQMQMSFNESKRAMEAEMQRQTQNVQQQLVMVRDQVEKQKLQADLEHIRQQLQDMKHENLRVQVNHNTKLQLANDRARRAEMEASRARDVAGRSMFMAGKTSKKVKQSQIAAQQERERPINIHNVVHGSQNTQTQQQRGGYGGWGWGGYGPAGFYPGRYWW